MLNPLRRAVLLGAVTGGRSATGLAALALTTPSGAGRQPDRALAASAVKAFLALAAGTELVIDKLPQTPSRLEPTGLAARVAVAAGVGVIAARRYGDPGSPGRESSGRTVLAGVLAAGTGAGTTWLGARWRSWAGQRTGRDYVGAGVEDVITLGLAVAAVRPG